MLDRYVDLYYVVCECVFVGGGALYVFYNFSHLDFCFQSWTMFSREAL